MVDGVAGRVCGESGQGLSDPAVSMIHEKFDRGVNAQTLRLSAKPNGRMQASAKSLPFLSRSNRPGRCAEPLELTVLR